MRAVSGAGGAGRRLSHRAAALAAVLFTMVGVAGIGLAGGARAEDDVPGPADTPMGAALTASIASIAPTYLTPSTSLAVRVAVTAGAMPLTGVQSVVSLTDAPLADTAAVDSFLANPAVASVREVGRGQPAEFLQGVPRAPGTLDAGSAATTSLLIDPTALQLPRGASGVYGVVVTTIADGVAPVTSAFLMTWTDATMPRIGVAVLANVTGSAERASALLQAAGDPRVALAVDSTTFPLIDPDLADIAGREAYLLPSGHVDLSSATHAGAGSLIDFALERSRANDPRELPWLAVPGTLDQGIVDAVAARGTTGIIAGLKLEYGRPEAPSPVATVLSSSGQTLPIALANLRLSELLATSSSTDATAAARLVAETALVSLASAGNGSAPPLLVSPGDSWIVDGTRPSNEIAAVFGAPWVRPTPLAAVLGIEATDVTVPAAAPATRDVPLETVVAIQQTIGRLDDLASATEQPSLLLDGPARDLLTAMSLPMRAGPEARATAIDTALEAARESLASVRVTSSSELTLVSSSGNVPLTVRNDLASAVTVVVAMTSRSPRLVIDQQPLATVPPGTEQTVFVPVTAVSSGDVLVTVALRSEEGATLAVAQSLKVRVRAEWGNVATGVATAALFVLLVAGVVRTVKRGRRDTRTGPTPDDAQFEAEASASR